MKTIIELFETSVEKYPDNIYLWQKENGEYKGTTYRQTRDEVLKFAAGLLALGIKKGDRLGLVSEGRNQWIICELGILYAGAINVPLSVKLDEAAELRFRLAHSGSRMIVVSARQADKIEAIRNDLPDLEKIFSIQPSLKWV